LIGTINEFHRNQTLAALSQRERDKTPTIGLLLLRSTAG
jgi:hypothetical protein